MYHLTAEERKPAIAEMVRICKPGGVLAFAYVNKIGVYFWGMALGAGNNLLPFWKRRKHSYYPNRKANDAILAGVNDIDNPFFFTMPEEIEALASDTGLRLIQNAGVDVILSRNIERMSEEQWACYVELAEAALEYPSCTGMSNHALMICRKEG